MTSEFYAALAGALVGGLMSFVLQFMSYRREDTLRNADRKNRAREEAEQRAEREAALAFSVLAKIGRAHTDIGIIRGHIQEGAERARVHGSRLSSTTLPLVSDPPKLMLTLDEMILVRDVKHDEVLNDAMNFPHIHAMYVDSMREFRQLRRDLAALTSETKIEADGMASSVFEGANASVAKIKQKEADDLLSALLGFCDPDFITVTNLFHDLQECLLDRLGKERLRTTWAVERIEAGKA